MVVGMTCAGKLGTLHAVDRLGTLRAIPCTAYPVPIRAVDRLGTGNAALNKSKLRMPPCKFEKIPPTTRAGSPQQSKKAGFFRAGLPHLEGKNRHEKCYV